MTQLVEVLVVLQKTQVQLPMTQMDSWQAPVAPALVDLIIL